MKVWVQGGRALSLSKRHFVGQGGQAAVYAHEGWAYKVYHQAKDMIPEGKVLELAAIADARVIRPEAILLDRGKRPIGYTMKHVPESYALCQIVPRVFRERNQLEASTSARLVQELREGIANVHDASVLLVDGNEMNFLVSRDFKSLYFVDVDSYQTPSYPATAIMESIRDRHATGFSQESDWFAFAVLAFQIFVGIHPYKGKHPSCKGLDARMQANLSVFDAEVRVPRAAYALSCIPSGYRDWLEAVLQQGVREAPPSALGSPKKRAVAHAPRLRSARLNYDLLAELPLPILGHFCRGHRQVLSTREGLYLQGRRLADRQPGFVGVAFSEAGYPVSVALREHRLHLQDLERGGAIELDARVSAATISGGRIHAVSGQRLLEVELEEQGGELRASVRSIAQVLELATQLFSGVALQDLLGTCYASVLCHAGRSYQLPLPELSGKRILDARLEAGVLMVSLNEQGRLHRLVFRFASDFQSYDCRKVADVDIASINFAVLDTGVCVCLAEDESIEIFRDRKDSTQLDRIEDTSLGTDMRIESRGGKVVVLSGNRLFHMSMK